MHFVRDLNEIVVLLFKEYSVVIGVEGGLMLKEISIFSQEVNLMA
jgi:hypothetical protein